MIIAEDRLVAGIDLNNLVIVDTPDALLVAQKGQSQKVKDVVSKLKKLTVKKHVKMSRCIAVGVNIHF